MGTSLALAMRMTLTYRGETASCDLSDPQCWTTSFKPEWQHVRASDLTAAYTVGFLGNLGKCRLTLTIPSHTAPEPQSSTLLIRGKIAGQAGNDCSWGLIGASLGTQQGR